METNWEPSGKPGSEDTIKFTNDAVISVGGSGKLTIAKIVTTGAGAVTFGCPVQFAGTYLVDNASASPVYSKGVTATYPDDSLAGGSEPNRTLPDGLTLTEDWIVPAAAKGTDKCFIVPAGARISGQKVTCESYTENHPCLRIDSGAVATFTGVQNAGNFGFHLDGGRLASTGDIQVDGANTGWYHLDYKSGISGTVEADRIYYPSSSSPGIIQAWATNYVIGAGGLKFDRSNGQYIFARTARFTATADMSFTGCKIELVNGSTFTLDTDGNRVEFNNEIMNKTGKLVKEGLGELVMQGNAKNYTGGTDVKAGTLTVGIANGLGTGAVTVRTGATLAWNVALSGNNALVLEDGAILKPAQDATFTATTVTLPESGTITVDMSGITLTDGVAVKVLSGVPAGAAAKFVAVLSEGVKGEFSIMGGVLSFTSGSSGVRTAVWTGGANDGNALTAGNWLVKDGNGYVVEGGQPDDQTEVTISGANVNLKIPSGSAFACASFLIGDITLTADCDWRGLAVTPSIAGRADLNGHNLRLNNLAAVSGGSLANGGEGVSGVLFDAQAGKYSEADYVTDVANLGTAENARIVIVRSSGDDSAAPLRVGNTANVWSEVRVEGGSITATSPNNTDQSTAVGAVGNSHAVLTIDGGAVSFNGQSRMMYSNMAGSGEINVKSGTLTINNWVSLGTGSGTATINQSGGTVFVPTSLNSGNGNFWMGAANNGTGVYNISNGELTFSGSVRNLWIGQKSGCTGIFNQSGGTVNISFSNDDNFGLGMDGNSSGKFVQTAGTVNSAARLRVGRSGVGELDIGGTFTMTAAGKGLALGGNSGGTGKLTLREDGVLTTSYIKKGAGKATATFAGGKVVAKDANNAATFISGLGDVTYAAGGLTVDTAGYNVSMLNNTVSASESGSAFVKQGDGTLTTDALPPVDTLKIEQGTLALTTDSDIDNTKLSDAPVLLHRWSFTDGSLADFVGGSTATKKGSGAITTSSGTVSLPGGQNGTCYLDMGMGVLPVSGAATIEIWARQDAVQSYSRIFTAGTAGNDFLTSIWSDGTKVDGDIFQMKSNTSGYADDIYRSNVMGGYALGTEFHISVTIEPLANGKALVSWAKRDASTGAVLKSVSETTKGEWSLAKYATGNFWIGHGYDNNDAQATYNEVRIWQGALSDAALTANAKAGPDALPSGRRLELAGGTLDLGGKTLTQPVVKATDGAIVNGTLVVADKLVVNLADCIAGKCLKVDGSVDLTGATLVIEDPEPEKFASCNGVITFMRTASGGSATIIGTPDCTQLPNGWHVQTSGGNARIMKKTGFTVIVR